MWQVGSVWGVVFRGRKEDDDKTLGALSFQTGDFLDVAIHLPNM